ncbi:peptidyl-prolyl cis-trans isomerase FKBP16-3, chloroplastic-like isoform X2 [Salvia splendens]|uniref:peptidyl-prolyl cis-trans isomerase FKBP16-3, chloroplastic-like isoform X2 n=1 Tax=Salvia splendens TaxID=180675 RepID=UPI001C273BC6|nr:peptidyl-prolyl cis-trans isomerase FKBP16-3, chloroplastic-like isoform X2 [Salvia splendens]
MASLSLLLPLGCIFGKGNAFSHQRAHKIRVGALASEPRLQDECAVMNRRRLMNVGVGLLGLVGGATLAEAAGLPPEDKPKLCDDACEKELENVPMVTTESGLQYKDIQIGSGPSPPIGFQVAANYVAMVPSGQIFDSSLEKGQVYIFRVGSGQVIKGLDEGILSMKVGGKRRLYIPGPLAFPKGLTSMLVCCSSRGWTMRSNSQSAFSTPIGLFFWIYTSAVKILTATL